MIQTIPYKKFSLKIHSENWTRKKINSCHFELTYKCDLHCTHCYTDCYNHPSNIEKELKTGRVKTLLDELRDQGVLWLTLSGGDPLARPDFREVYNYARGKGFLITVLTNGCRVDETIARWLAKAPPFSIDITLNAVTDRLYDSISQVEGSYKKALNGITLLRQSAIPLKIKTLITRENLAQVPKIEKFVRKMGSDFMPDPILHPRLDGDIAPCAMRIEPEAAAGIMGVSALPSKQRKTDPEPSLFQCAVRNRDGIGIDPYGNAYICELIRFPKIALYEIGVDAAVTKLINFLSAKEFDASSKCRSCEREADCYRCPGRAYLETRDMTKEIPYYCSVACAKEESV